MNLTKMLSLTVCTAISCAGTVLAQGQGWTGKVGESAQDKAVLVETLKQVGPGDCVEFTRRTLRAATRLLMNTDTKAVHYIETSLLCVAHASANQGEDGQILYSVVAETIAIAPVAYLPALVREMSKSFDPEVNQLTNDQYREMAEKGVKACVKRNAEAGDTTVRNTFAVLLFTRSASRVPGLQDTLLALLPDDRSRGLAAKWLADAASDNYSGILAAAEIEIAPPMPAINMLGYPQVARLLAYLGMTDSAFEALVLAGGMGSSQDMVDMQIDAGFQQTPLPVGPVGPGGYQNQGLSVWGSTGTSGSGSSPAWCWCSVQTSGRR